MTLSPPSSTVFSELQALRESYAAELPDRLDLVEQLWRQRRDPTALAELHRHVHGLAGSGGTFGFAALSRSARQLELLLKVMLEENHPDPKHAAAAEQLLGALRQAAMQPDDEFQTAPADVSHNNNAGHGIVLLDPDPAAGEALAVQLETLGYPCRVAHTEQQLEKLVQAATPLAAVLYPTDDHSFTALRDNGGNRVPLVFVSSRDDFNNRLRSVRAGGRAYFTKPVDTLALAAVLDELTLKNPSEPYRILIIEDDEALARYYALILESAGMTARVVNDPMAVMKALREFRPDLLLMDIYMPGCNGPELATVIRQQPAFIGIPIVFLSGETDGDKQLAAMSRGADDFLNKSIIAEHLVGSIAARVTRSRSIRALMVSDSLTGLYNHSYIKEQLALELSRATRHRTPMAFAMLDIDKFKSVNDNHGHLTGDRVIKSLARHLRQRLRNSDVIGRYGGEEFAVILPATSVEAAAKVMDEIRAGFFRLQHQTEHGDISVSFSCGIAGYPGYDSAQSLNDAADKALYRAKEAGRNQVVLAQ